MKQHTVIEEEMKREESSYDNDQIDELEEDHLSLKFMQKVIITDQYIEEPS